MRRWILVLAVAYAAACSAETPLPQPPLFEGGGDAGSRPAQDIDGSVGLSLDARRVPDAALAEAGSQPDARTVDAPVTIDTAPDTALQACSLITQNCAQTQRACYRSGSGGSACFPAGGVPSGGPCTLDEDCARGYACPENRQFCERLCDTQQGCGGGGSCVALPDYTNVGVCEF